MNLLLKTLFYFHLERDHLNLLSWLILKSLTIDLKPLGGQSCTALEERLLHSLW